MSKADTIPEFIRSYTNAWVGIRVNGKVYPATLNSRPGTPEHVAFKYNTGPEGKQLSKDVHWMNERENILRNYPDLGMVKVGPTVGYINSRPLRQWHKGYYPPNVRLWIPNGDDINKVQPNVRFNPTHPSILWQLYNREFWHPLEAIRLIEEGEGVGYPLSKSFGVYIKEDVESPLICYKRQTIGTYDGLGVWKLMDSYKIYKEQFLRETAVEAR